MPRDATYRDRNGILFAIQNGHDVAVAVRHGAFEGCGKVAPCIRRYLCDFGDDCVWERGVHDFDFVQISALHEGVVVGHDGSLVPCWQCR